MRITIGRAVLVRVRSWTKFCEALPLVGSGKYSRIAFAIGSIRAAGITFPGNGFRTKPPAGFGCVVNGS